MYGKLVRLAGRYNVQVALNFHATARRSFSHHNNHLHEDCCCFLQNDMLRASKVLDIFVLSSHRQTQTGMKNRGEKAVLISQIPRQVANAHARRGATPPSHASSSSPRTGLPCKHLVDPREALVKHARRRHGDSGPWRSGKNQEVEREHITSSLLKSRAFPLEGWTFFQEQTQTTSTTHDPCHHDYDNPTNNARPNNRFD